MAAGAPVRFYHGHDGCRYFVVPKTRTDWWLAKINGNKRRDAANEAKLVADGWKIITIFECALKPKTKEETLQNLLISPLDLFTFNAYFLRFYQDW